MLNISPRRHLTLDVKHNTIRHLSPTLKATWFIVLTRKMKFQVNKFSSHMIFIKHALASQVSLVEES